MTQGKRVLSESLKALAATAVGRWTCRRAAAFNLLPHSVVDWLPPATPFRITVPGGGHFLYRRTGLDYIGKYIYWNDFAGWESETLKVFISYARSSRRFLDIGANTGVYSLVVCAVNPIAVVTAFEPVPAVFQRLTDNIVLNGWAGRCMAFPKAIADYNGRSSFHIPYGEVPSSASLHLHGFRGMEGTLVDTDVATIDSLLTEDDSVDLVKIDVEGFEDRVLAGMARVLEASRPVLFLECNADGPAKEITSILAPLGYRFQRLSRTGRISVQGIIPDPMDRERNFLCMPRG